MKSIAELLASLPERERLSELSRLKQDDAAKLLWDWKFWGRPEQFPPPGKWFTWCVLAGRGFGKTRTGAEWVRSMACGRTPLGKSAARRISIVAETAADARDVLVEGDSGILSVHPPDFRPLYEPSKRRLTWPNGAIATLFNAIEPDQLRGPQSDAAWSDEFAKWRYAQETWDNLQFGLRLGDNPRQVVTTTPRPILALKQLVADPSTIVTRGSTYDNRSNLAPSFVHQVETKYTGTRLGRQELLGEILDDAVGALWRRAKLDETRRSKGTKLPDMQRVVVAIDPASSSGGIGDYNGGAETGIIVAGLGVDGRGYVLDDVTCSLDPDGWARRAIAAYDIYKADVVVAEINQGGEMVEAVLRSVRPFINVDTVRASRGKVTRAEPVAALYEQGRVSHVGGFAALEDQMVVFTPFGIEGGTTGDRVDALVWALTHLFPEMINFVAVNKTPKPPVDRFRRDDRDDDSGDWKTV
jgi:phage terminase large subunit-like protein